jgi:hypothetical protein
MGDNNYNNHAGNNYNNHAGLINLVLRSQLHKHKEAEDKRKLVQMNMMTPHGISPYVIETLKGIPSQYPRPRPQLPPTDSLDALMNSVAKGNNKSRRRGTKRRGKGRRGTKRRGKGRN